MSFQICKLKLTFNFSLVTYKSTVTKCLVQTAVSSFVSLDDMEKDKEWLTSFGEERCGGMGGGDWGILSDAYLHLQFQVVSIF